jgi:hypothetical protein
LFHAQGVDLVIEAHEHSYERLYPIFDGKVERFNYINPRAPVHIITGAAGSTEGIDGWEGMIIRINVMCLIYFTNQG